MSSRRAGCQCVDSWSDGYGGVFGQRDRIQQGARHVCDGGKRWYFEFLVREEMMWLGIRTDLCDRDKDQRTRLKSEYHGYSRPYPLMPFQPITRKTCKTEMLTRRSRRRPSWTLPSAKTRICLHSRSLLAFFDSVLTSLLQRLFVRLVKGLHRRCPDEQDASHAASSSAG